MVIPKDLKNMTEYALRILLLIIFSGIVYGAEQLKLTAVNDSPNVALLYSQVGNNHLPSASDPVTDLQLRNRLCHHVIGSGYFMRRGIRFINFDENLPINPSRNSLRYLIIFQHIYSLIIESLFPYNLGNFRFVDTSGRVNTVLENVVLCLANASHNNRIVPFYITKEYNLDNSSEYKPARFVFEHYSTRSNPQPRLILAEEPAVGYVRADLGIELLYLWTREYHVPSDNNTHDPLCKMTSPWQDLTSQLERLCVSVLGSAYFEGKELYPRKSRISDLCGIREITFQTEEGIEFSKMKSNRSYQEWMILCEGETTENQYYISRSYNTNRVLVYRHNKWDGNVYIENLTTNVFIWDEGGGGGPHKRKRVNSEESECNNDQPDRKTNRKKSEEPLDH